MDAAIRQELDDFLNQRESNVRRDFRGAEIITF